MTNALTNRSGTLLAAQLDYILVDGSGSMQGKWWPTMGALDGFMSALRSQGIQSHGIVSVFSGRELQDIQRDAVIADWPTFHAQPLGSSWSDTPLYDAINMMGRHLRDLDPPRASIVIVTDGDENGSRHTNATQAKAILDWCRAKGWQVTFLGADFNNDRQAKLLGATPRNSVSVRAMKLLEAGKAIGEKRVRNALYGEDINFTDDEKTTFGGYLTGPSKE